MLQDNEELLLRKRVPIGQQGCETLVSMCGVCPAGCGVCVTLRDGRIERLQPLAGHPRGIVCQRGAVAREIVYSEDRILYPQTRTSSGRLRRTSWDRAYETIVTRLQEIAAEDGPEAICVYTGRGNFEVGLNEMFAPSGTVESSANAVLFPFGSPNATGIGSLCYTASGMIAPRACFGQNRRNMHEDIEKADLVLVWGANPATDSPPINLRRLKRARARGARIVVIDHLRSQTAKQTDAEWLAIRPGTDGALALGMIYVLIEERLHDPELVERWTHGFADLVEYVQQFTPERVAATTGIPADRVRSLARDVAAYACTALMYTGLEYSGCGVQAIRAVWSLQALAGNLDVPGGNQFKSPDRLKPNRLLTDRPAGAREPIGAREFPLYCEVRKEAHAVGLPRAILEGVPYPVRAMIVSGASIITSWPNPERWRRALASLDLLVVIDRFPTADAELADVVLPAATGFEIESYMVYDENYVQLRQRVIEPRGEARNDYLIFAELASRLGYGHRWPQSEEGMIRYALEGSGVTLEELRAHPEGIKLPEPEIRYRKWERGELRGDKKPGFETPTGKLELASEWLSDYGYDPLPVYTEPREGPSSPELAQYPLVLNTGTRTQTAFRSQHHNIESLSRKQPWPLVHIHPDDARARGIEDGDEVWVVSPRGRVVFRARVTDDIVRGVVEANMGGGGPLGPVAWQRCNVNELTDSDNLDPLSGFPVFRALLCEVVKVSGRA